VNFEDGEQVAIQNPIDQPFFLRLVSGVDEHRGQNSSGG
jgi:hypothetical protein